LRAGDWAGYGRVLEELGETLSRLEEILQAGTVEGGGEPR
jgi:hypothetical protein